MKMYKTTWYNTTIEEVDIISRTEKTVTYNGGSRNWRENIVSSLYRWHDTKEDAVAFLKKRCQSDIEQAEKNIAKAKLELSEIEKNHA